MNTSIDINQSVCIKDVNYLTGTLYKNICNGSETFVQYGTATMLIAAFLVALLLSLFLLIVPLLWKILKWEI